MGCANAQFVTQRDADGVYSTGAGVTLPRITQAASAGIPSADSLHDARHVCVIETVVSADGTPGMFRVLSPPSAFDQSAIDAVRKSQFEPGVHRRKPVPVRIPVFVPFGGKSAIPVLLEDLKAQKRATVPRLTNNVDAEYSEEARSKQIDGTVFIQLTVTEDGNPTDIRVVGPAGYGLDEKALEAVRKYKFKPAMIDGIPSTFPINVGVSFHIGKIGDA
jgi:TonB family protein